MIKLDVRVAVLASGDRESGEGGSTAERTIRDVLEEKVGFQVGAVICNNPPGSVGVYPKIEALNNEFGLKGDERIDVLWIGPGNYPDGKLARGQRLSESEAICRKLEERDIGYVSMQGYMRILTGEFLETWAWQPQYADDPHFSFRNGLYHPRARVMNNHPGILPFTADTHTYETHEEALRLRWAGVIEHTAMSWLLAAEAIDAGPMITEIPVPIYWTDNAKTIGDTVQMIEKEYTALVIERHLARRQEYIEASNG